MTSGSNQPLWWLRVKLLPRLLLWVVLLAAGLGAAGWAAGSALVESLRWQPSLFPYLQAGAGLLGLILLALSGYKLLEWSDDWKTAGRIVVDSDGGYDRPLTHFFQRLMLAERGPVRRYLRRQFSGRVSVTNVFRAASLEMWHNAADVRNLLDRVDPRDQKPIGEHGWFVRIAHHCARDFAQRNGDVADTAQGVFLDFVSHRLGVWDRLGLAGDAKLPGLVLEFHQAMESLSGQHGDLKRILEEDLNTDLLTVAERRFGEAHPDRRKAIGLLRHKLGLRG